MAALGLVYGQLGIAGTVYSDLTELTPPAAEGQRMTHVTSLSSVFPTKELGHIPATISGEIELASADVAAFVIDVRTGTNERKISFVIGTVECYAYAYSGDINNLVCVDPHGGATLYTASFAFPLSRSKVYQASDDSVLWGS